MDSHKVVSRQEWLEARKKFLVKEKEFTRLRDQFTQELRNLPWERVEKDYVFEGAGGNQSLTDLFDGKSQLVIYHFMFHPDSEVGCPHCSLRADGFNGIGVHLAHRDTALIAVSRAPYPKLEAYRRRMGWSFPWFSSHGSDFNYDYHVSFTPDQMARKTAFFNYEIQDSSASEREGHSVFTRDGADIFHTYSCYARGNEPLNIHYHYLDMTPKGRDEGGRGPTWVRRHDEYAQDAGVKK